MKSWVSKQPPPKPIVNNLPDEIPELIKLADNKIDRAISISDLQMAVAAMDKSLELIAAKSPDAGTELSAELVEVHVRLAIACFLICERLNDEDLRLAWIGRGIEAAQALTEAGTDRVEGYYYLAVLKGRRAEYGGLSAFIEVRQVEEFGLKAAALDPAYEDGAPLRLLALLYAKAPGWPTSVGDVDKALEYAEKALDISDYPLNHMTRGEVLIEAEEYEKARDELKLVLAAPRTGKWAREADRWGIHVRKLLRDLNKKK